MLKKGYILRILKKKTKKVTLRVLKRWWRKHDIGFSRDIDFRRPLYSTHSAYLDIIFKILSGIVYEQFLKDETAAILSNSNMNFVYQRCF